MFPAYVLYFLLAASAGLAIGNDQTWTVRPGDNLEIISMALDIPKAEIKKRNPNLLETNLQIGQKLKLPLRSHVEITSLERELDAKAARIAALEGMNSDLENQLARARSQLRWHPVWFWGFWICFGIIAFIVAGAFWIFRQTHPRVFDEPHERSLTDLKESQARLRSAFPLDQDAPATPPGQWRPPLKRVKAEG